MRADLDTKLRQMTTAERERLALVRGCSDFPRNFYSWIGFSI
jgi:hypothetical protein